MQILQPAVNGPIGPGMEVRLQTDFIGPIEVGSRFTIQLFPPTEEQAIAQGQIFTQVPTPSMILGSWQDSPTQGGLRIPTQLSSTPHSAPARLSATLTSPLGAVLDTTTIDVQYDAVTGTQWIVNEQTATAGVDPGDIQIIKQAVTLDVGGVIRGVASMIGGVPPNFFVKELITPDRTGSGTLTRPRGSLTTAANGIAWLVVDRKAGIGIDEGAPDRLELVGLELRYVLRLADQTAFTAQHQSVLELDGVWLWGLQTPSWIDYFIVPGLTVRFWWLIPTFTPFFEGDPSTSVPIPNPLGTTIGG